MWGKTLFLICSFAAYQNSFAETLPQAIQALLEHYPSLRAQQYKLDAVKEKIPQARAGLLPQVSVEISAVQVENGIIENVLDSDGGLLNTGISVRQNIYQGGQINAGIARAKANMDSAVHNYNAFEQDLLVTAIRTYMDVLLQENIFEIRKKNVQAVGVLETAAKARFKIGRVTRTDIAQAKASLYRSQAGLTQAQSSLFAARTRYKQFFGHIPLQLQQPQSFPYVPTSLDEALSIAHNNNPEILRQIANVEASLQTLKAKKGKRLPSVYLDLKYGDIEGFRQSYLDQDALSLTGTLSIPLYSGGQISSGIREASAMREQVRMDLAATRKQVDNDVTTNWNNLKNSQTTAQIRQAQVDAAEQAYKGILEEQKLGLRSTFEVLNIENAVIEARLSFAIAQTDIIIISAQLLDSIGMLGQAFANGGKP